MKLDYCRETDYSGKKTDRQVDEVSHKLSPSQPGRPGGSNVSTFTDGVGRAGNIAICAISSEQRLKTKDLHTDYSHFLNMKTNFQCFKIKPG